MKSCILPGLMSGVLFVFGCQLYTLKTNQKPIITVDIQRLIRQTAEALAQSKVSEDQLHQRVTLFKKDLEKSLVEFAQKHKCYVVSSNLIYGDVIDMTDHFIAYHNQSEGNVSEKTADMHARGNSK